MKLADKRILITGATGGLGQSLAIQLAQKGAVICLAGRDLTRLKQLQASIQAEGGTAHYVIADMTDNNMPTTIIQQATDSMGVVDILILNAGVLDFTALEQQNEQRIAQLVHINVIAVIQLARTFVVYFKQRKQGHLMFVGSIFGSLGFPYFATYCASKFAVHGFSQALRRELVDSPIGITYIAPRAIETPMNDDRSNALWKAAGQTVDTAADVAAKMVRALEKQQKEVFIGQPQSLFAWLNGLVPRLVDLGMKAQARVARKYL